MPERPGLGEGQVIFPSVGPQIGLPQPGLPGSIPPTPGNPGRPYDPEYDDAWTILKRLLGVPPPGQVNNTTNPTGSDGAPRPSVIVRPEEGRVPIVYGRQKFAGQVIAAWGQTYSTAHYVVAVCAGPIDAIEDIWAGGASIGASGAIPGLTYTVHLGGLNQAQDSVAIAATANSFISRLPGLVYVVFTVEGGPNGFSGDLSNFLFTVRGFQCYDHRTGLTAWTQNPAVCIAHYLTNVLYGPGVDASYVDWTAFDLAADRCDEVVSGSARYVMNAVYSAESDAGQLLDAMRLVCCADGPFMQEGLYRIVVDAPQTLSADADIEVQTPAGTVNGVNLVFALAQTLTAGSYLVVIDGQACVYTTDFTISGTTLTCAVGRAPTQWIRVIKGDRATLLLETPTGTVNGTNKVFTVTGSIPAGSYVVIVDGQFLINGTDYELDGTTLTIDAGRAAPLTWIRVLRGVGTDLVHEAPTGAMGQKVFGLSGALTANEYFVAIDGQGVISTTDYAVSADVLTVDAARAAPLDWVRVFRGRPSSTVHTFTDTLNCSNVSTDPVATNDAPTKVIVRFHNAAKNYDLDFATAEHPDLASGGVELRPAEYMVEGVSGLIHANQLAVYILQQGRIDLRVSFLALPEAENLVRGQLITLTSIDGLSTQPLLVQDLKWTETLGYRVACRQYSEDLYGDTVPDEDTPVASAFGNPWAAPPDVTGTSDDFEIFPFTSTATRTVDRLRQATDFVLPATYQILKRLRIRTAVGPGADTATWEDMVATDRPIPLEGNFSPGRLFNDALIAGTNTYDFTGTGAPTYMFESRLLRRMIIKVENIRGVLSAGVTIDGAASYVTTDLRVTPPDPPKAFQGSHITGSLYIAPPRDGVTLIDAGTGTWTMTGGYSAFDATKVMDGLVAASFVTTDGTTGYLKLDFGVDGERNLGQFDLVYNTTPGAGNSTIFFIEFSDDDITYHPAFPGISSSSTVAGHDEWVYPCYVDKAYRYWRIKLSGTFLTTPYSLNEIRLYDVDLAPDIVSYEFRAGTDGLGDILATIPNESLPMWDFRYWILPTTIIKTFDPVTGFTEYLGQFTIHAVSANGLKSSGLTAALDDSTYQAESTIG